MHETLIRRDAELWPLADMLSHFGTTNSDVTPEFCDADVLSHPAGHYGYYACYGYDDCYRRYSTRSH